MIESVSRLLAFCVVAPILIISIVVAGAVLFTLQWVDNLKGTMTWKQTSENIKRGGTKDNERDTEV